MTDMCVEKMKNEKKKKNGNKYHSSSIQNACLAKISFIFYFTSRH